VWCYKNKTVGRLYFVYPPSTIGYTGQTCIRLTRNDRLVRPWRRAYSSWSSSSSRFRYLIIFSIVGYVDYNIEFSITSFSRFKQSTGFINGATTVVPYCSCEIFHPAVNKSNIWPTDLESISKNRSSSSSSSSSKSSSSKLQGIHIALSIHTTQNSNIYCL